MCSTCCRFTFPHAPLFSELDCSSSLHLPEISRGCYPSLCTALRQQCLYSSFRRASAITLKSTLSSVCTLVDSPVTACCLQFGLFICPFCKIIFVSWITLSKLQDTSSLVWLTFGFVWVFPLTHLYPSRSLGRRSEILQSQSTPQKDWHPSLRSKKHWWYVQRHCFYSYGFFVSLRRNISMKDVSLSVSWNFNRSSSWCRDTILHA